MGQIRKSRLVRADLDTVWNAVADMSYVHNFHPKVDKSPLLTGNATGLGATRRCDFYDGTSVVEEVVAVRPREFVEIALSEFSMPFSRAKARIDVAAEGDDRTRVQLTMDFSMKYGPVGWLMEAAMVRPMMSQMLDQVLAGLEHHVVTGEYIGENGAPVTAAA